MASLSVVVAIGGSNPLVPVADKSSRAVLDLGAVEAPMDMLALTAIAPLDPGATSKLPSGLSAIVPPEIIDTLALVPNICKAPAESWLINLFAPTAIEELPRLRLYNPAYAPV